MITGFANVANVHEGLREDDSDSCEGDGNVLSLVSQWREALVTSLFGDELHSFVVFGDPFFGVFFGVGSGDGTAVFAAVHSFPGVSMCRLNLLL